MSLTMHQRILRALDALECGKWAEFDAGFCGHTAVKLWMQHKISKEEMYSIADRVTVLCGGEI